MTRSINPLATTAVVVLIVAVLMACIQRRSLREILGFDSKMVGLYRDIALAAVASIAGLWSILSLNGTTSFDRRLGIISILVSMACCGLSPNRLVLFGIVIGVVAVQGWFALAFYGVRFLWIAIPATLLETVYLLIFGKRKLSPDKSEGIVKQ